MGFNDFKNINIPWVEFYKELTMVSQYKSVAKNCQMSEYLFITMLCAKISKALTEIIRK